MMFAKPVALNRDAHRDLLFQPMGAYGFAAAMNAVPLCAAEFFAAAKEYAIVFVRPPQGAPFPVIVLGLNQDQNCFVSPSGEWQARYLPFAVRAYPFAVTETADPGNLQVLIDEAYPGFGDTVGTALFGDSGDPSPGLEQKLKFLRAHRQEIGRTSQFGADIARLGLLTERGAKLQIDGNVLCHLKGFWVVDEDKLSALDDAQLLTLARGGHLALITAHLLSIGNLALLAPRVKANDLETSTALPVAKNKRKV